MLINTDRNNWYVQIVEKATKLSVKTMGPMSEARAWKVCRGAEINLNHNDYQVDICQDKARRKEKGEQPCSQ